MTKSDPLIPNCSTGVWDMVGSFSNVATYREPIIPYFSTIYLPLLGM